MAKNVRRARILSSIQELGESSLEGSQLRGIDALRQIRAHGDDGPFDIDLIPAPPGHAEGAKKRRARILVELNPLESAEAVVGSVVVTADRERPVEPPNVGFLLRMSLPRKTRENIIGDMEETFRTIHLPLHGPFRARCLYLRDVFWEVFRAFWLCIRWFVGAGFLAKTADWISQKLSGG